MKTTYDVLKGILYLKTDLFRAIRKENVFLDNVRIILDETIGRESQLSLIPVARLPYGEDASLVLEEGKQHKEEERIADGIRDLMQKEFLCTEHYLVSVRFLGYFGNGALPFFDATFIRYFRSRPTTKVIVCKAEKVKDLPEAGIRVSRLLGTHKYFAFEYDEKTDEVVRVAYSDRVSDAIDLHLEKGNGTCVYE